MELTKEYFDNAKLTGSVRSSGMLEKGVSDAWKDIPHGRALPQEQRPCL